MHGPMQARETVPEKYQLISKFWLSSGSLFCLFNFSNFLKVRGAKAKAPVGGAAGGGGKGAKAMVKPVLTVETDAKKVNNKHLEMS
jgi:hypothetical protein